MLIIGALIMKAFWNLLRKKEAIFRKGWESEIIKCISSVDWKRDKLFLGQIRRGLSSSLR